MISFFASHINMFKHRLVVFACFKCLLWEEILFSLLGMQFFKCLPLLIQTHSIKKKKKLPSSLVKISLENMGCDVWNAGAEGKWGTWLVSSSTGGVEKPRDQSPQNGASSKTWCLSVSGTCLSTTEHHVIRIPFQQDHSPVTWLWTQHLKVSTVATLTLIWSPSFLQTQFIFTLGKLGVPSVLTHSCLPFLILQAL